MDEKLKRSLGDITAPPPSGTARADALKAAMAAFEEAHGQKDEAETKKNAGAVQGHAIGGRLKSIASTIKGKWTMDIRIPLGASLAAILAVPLGVAFLSQTALTPPGPVFHQPAIRGEGPAVAEADAAMTDADMVNREAAAPPAQIALPPLPFPSSEPAPAPRPAAPPVVGPAGGAAVETRGVTVEQMTSGPQSGPLSLRSGTVDLSGAFAAGDQFTAFAEGGVQMVAQNPVSTFSVDVDTTAYAYARRMLEMGQMPHPDAVRVEEMINYFDYDYRAPEAGEGPFLPQVSVTPSPWNGENRLVHIGIKGEAVDLEAVPPANLVLLIGTSGSMNAPDRLPLLQRAMALLLGELGPEDTVSIVTYAGSAGVALEPTPASERARILSVIEGLSASGSTAGADGLSTAYRLAEQAFIAEGTNRVLLATDGDFNVGIADPQGLERLIADKRETGIFLSVLGFGMGNYNDATMQALAQAGNGNAAYIDSYSEARKVLVEELGGTLMTIASDVKVQVEFNPETVSEYRLIGYETRALAREDFNDDAVDAGDVGAGHSVTAIYEITPVGARGLVDPLRYGGEAAAPVPGESAEEYGFLKIRYKAPGSAESTLIEAPIPVVSDAEAEAAFTGDIRFATAVAAFGQKLRGTSAVRGMDWADIRALAVSGRGPDETGRRAEFIRLVDIASGLGR